jgi:D-tyrosyl-tRNA(Tyr) deacylase
VRAVVQRVSAARVRVGDRVTGEIAKGLLALVGVERGDGASDVRYVVDKIRHARLFPSASGTPMDRSVMDVGGAILLVSQFTLFGDLRKGRRPSFSTAEDPETARGVYESLVRELRIVPLTVETGEYRASMDVESTNDGPITILVDSRRLF